MFKSWKSRAAMVVSVVAALAMAGAMPASAAKGGTDRPDKATGSLSGVITILGIGCAGACYDVSVVLDGTAQTSHGGRSAVHAEGPATLGAGGLVSPPGQPVITTVAANGDPTTTVPTTALDASGVVCPAGSGPFKQGELITGGTGRFASATGSLVVSGCGAIGPGPDALHLTLTETFTAVGTINY